MNVSQHYDESKSVEVIEIKRLSDTNNLRALATVKLGRVVLHECRIVQQPGQRAWVSLPQREYTFEGERRFKALVEVSESLKREITRVVLAAWERGEQ